MGVVVLVVVETTLGCFVGGLVIMVVVLVAAVVDVVIKVVLVDGIVVLVGACVTDNKITLMIIQAQKPLSLCIPNRNMLITCNISLH